jgi:ketosteroid isomerase-like protein
MHNKMSTGITLVLALSGLVLGQTSPASRKQPERGLTEALVREILEVKRQYDAAQLANDGAWFERMLADDYVFIGADGVVSSKADFVRDMRSRDLIWKSVAVKDVRVRIYGNTAVVTGRFFGEGTYKGSPLDERQRYTSVWIKRNGRWRGISEHGSKLNPPDDH